MGEALSPPDDEQLLALLSIADEMAIERRQPGAGMAYEVLFIAAQVLATGHEMNVKQVRAMWAVLHGGKISDLDGVGIRLIATQVERALIRLTIPQIDRDGVIAFTHHALRRIDAALSQLTAEQIDEWLTLHSPMKKRGRLTVAGIVTEMLLAAGALGTRRHDDRQRVLSRVTAALKSEPLWNEPL